MTGAIMKRWVGMQTEQVVLHIMSPAVAREAVDAALNERS